MCTFDGAGEGLQVPDERLPAGSTDASVPGRAGPGPRGVGLNN